MVDLLEILPLMSKERVSVPKMLRLRAIGSKNGALSQKLFCDACCETNLCAIAERFIS